MIKSCLARIGCLTVVALLAAGAWVFRDEIGSWWERLEITSTSEPSEELARRAESKLERVAGSRSGGRIRLTQAELQSLVTYRIAPYLVEGIDDPLVEVGDSSVLVSAILAPEELSARVPTELLQQFLADSTRVTAELVPRVFSRGVAEIRVARLQTGALRVPSLMVPWILGALEIPGVNTSGNLVFLPIPPRVTRIEVAPGEVVFVLDGPSEREG